MRLLIILLVFVPASVFSQAVSKGIALYDARKPAEAKKILASVPEDAEGYAEARYYLGRISFDAREFDDAADYFEEAIEADDQVAEYHNWYGNALGNIAQDANVMRQGFLAPKMKNAWEKAVALRTDYIEPRQSLIQFYLQAPGFMGGSIEQAKEMARQITRLKPAEGHRQMGNIFLYDKKPAEAEKEFLEMVKTDASYAPALANFYLTQKQYDKAFDMFEDALRKDPEDWLSIYQLGKTSALSGQRLERGEQCLRQYLTHTPGSGEPSHAGAYMRLGQIFEKKGRLADARKQYEAALSRDASLQEAKDGLARVSK
jgi:tetratricopeptide (TPR) repeat protein